MLAVLEGLRTRGGLMPDREAAERIGSQEPQVQKELAREFFESTIGKDLGQVRSAYEVYMALKGTEFSKTFRELESERLVAAGYSPLTL